MVFAQMDQNVTGLEERIDHCHSEVCKLEDKWQKQWNILQDLLMKVDTLEAREMEREMDCHSGGHNPGAVV